MKISPLGDSALTLDFADESSDRARLLGRTLSAAERLEGANLPGVMDVTCAYESVAVFFDPARIEQDFEDKIGALVSSAGIRALRKARKIASRRVLSAPGVFQRETRAARLGR